MSNAVEEIEKHGFASAPLEPDANDSEILHNLFSAPYQNRFITHYFPEIEYFKLNSIRGTESHLYTELAVVTYTDKPIPTLFSSAPFFRKSIRFRDEKEVRLLARTKMEHLPKEPGTKYLAESPEFQLVEVDLKTLMDVVVIGSKVSEEEFIFLKTWIQSLSSSAAVRRSSCK